MANTRDNSEIATTPPWRARVLTLYPEMFPGPLGHALAGRALEDERWVLETDDIRRDAIDKHGSVDDQPFGGGPGMVMRADVVTRAVDRARAAFEDGRCIYLSPRGRPLTQAFAQELAAGAGVILLCGRFEGVDERALGARDLMEVSIGDYVLSGGEIAAMALLDSCVRLLPGVVGAEASLAEESFEHDLLEYPQFTRPRLFEGRAVPEVLLSGNHAAIGAWRRAQAEKITQERRADLWARHRASEINPTRAKS